MPLFLAMSIFQGRLQDDAFDRLRSLQPDGIQLTPGNLPCAGFADRVAATALPTRPHHGFCWDRYRRRVWDPAGRPIDIEPERSVHPPRERDLTQSPEAWLDLAAEHDLLLETMYPGYVLGCGAQLEAAMQRRIRLAVDVSHLFIQSCLGVLSDATRRRVLAYDRVEEVHVSANDGRRDQHAPLSASTPGLDYAREQLPRLPVVVESYWHRVGADAQLAQLALLR